jgi:hypothetical protein
LSSLSFQPSAELALTKLAKSARIPASASLKPSRELAATKLVDATQILFSDVPTRTNNQADSRTVASPEFDNSLGISPSHSVTSSMNAAIDGTDLFVPSIPLQIQVLETTSPESSGIHANADGQAGGKRLVWQWE